jgi:hypothetical protein
MMTSDGGQIFVRSEGATDEATGSLPGTFKFETGHPKYQWLNKAIGRPSLIISLLVRKAKYFTVVAVGEIIETNVLAGKGLLRIDTWIVHPLGKTVSSFK